MTKIMWFSRHMPIPKQIKELDRIFGGATVKIDKKPFSDAKDIIKRFKETNADEMVVVAPLSVINEICQRGVQPLYAEMELVQDGKYDVDVNGRKFRFVKFTRITGIEIKKEELKKE